MSITNKTTWSVEDAFSQVIFAHEWSNSRASSVPNHYKTNSGTGGSGLTNCPDLNNSGWSHVGIDGGWISTATTGTVGDITNSALYHVFGQTGSNDTVHYMVNSALGNVTGGSGFCKFSVTHPNRTSYANFVSRPVQVNINGDTNYLSNRNNSASKFPLLMTDYRSYLNNLSYGTVMNSVTLSRFKSNLQNLVNTIVSQSYYHYFYSFFGLPLSTINGAGQITYTSLIDPYLYAMWYGFNNSDTGYSTFYDYVDADLRTNDILPILIWNVWDAVYSNYQLELVTGFSRIDGNAFIKKAHPSNSLIKSYLKSTLSIPGDINSSFLRELRRNKVDAGVYKTKLNTSNNKLTFNQTVVHTKGTSDYNSIKSTLSSVNNKLK